VTTDGSRLTVSLAVARLMRIRIELRIFETVAGETKLILNQVVLFSRRRRGGDARSSTDPFGQHNTRAAAHCDAEGFAALLAKSPND
jgi:hypothetical protein